MNKRDTLKVKFNNYLNRLIVINEREYGTSSLTLATYSRVKLKESRRQVRLSV